MKNWYGYIRTALFAAVGFLIAGTVFAQQSRVNRYSQTTFSGSYSSISSTGTYIASGDDDYNFFSLPFDFNYDSTTYSAGTTVMACTNGWMSFNTSADPYSYGNYVGSSSYAETISPWMLDDYVCDAIYGTVSGTAPNRVLTIEWSFLGLYDNACDDSYYTDIQVKLYESTNVIEFLYSNHDEYMGTSWTGDQAGVGLNGGTSPDFQYLAYSGGPSDNTPSSDIRWTPAPLPPPPAHLTLQPKDVDFGNLLTGEDTTICVNFSDLGPGTLIVTSLALTGNPDYTIVSGPAVLDSFHTGEGGSICVKFSPVASGTRTAQLVLTTNGKDSGQQIVNLTGQGIAPGINAPVTSIFRKYRVRVGDSAVVGIPFQSNGSGSLTISSVTVSGQNPDQYHVRSYPMDDIPTGDWDTVFVVFAPTFEGQAFATITINSDALNNPAVAVSAFGSGIIPRLALNPTSLAFDSVFVGQQVCHDITLYNPGSDTVAILQEQKSSGDYDFTFTPIAGGDTLLAPGEQEPFTVCFTPLQQGLRTAVVRFYSNIPRTFPGGQDTSQVVLEVTGTGVPYGHLALTGSSVDTSIVGIQNCVSDTVVNSGTAPVTVESASLIGADSTDFSISGIALPMTLQPQERRVIEYCFTPSARGSRSAAIVLTGNTAGTSATMTLQLFGFGVEVCASTSPTTAFDTKTLVGKTDTATVTVTNCGDVATAYTATLPASATMYQILGGAMSASVAAGSNASYTLVYTPTAIGANTSTLAITGGVGVTPMSVALNGVGGGVIASASSGDAGSVGVGACSDFTVTIMNTGNMDWTPGTPTIAGPDAADFTFVSLVPSTIPAGGSAVLTLKFCPQNKAAETATVTFPNADITPVTPLTLALTGTGITNGVAEITSRDGYTLGQSYPNPMHHTADIIVTMPKSAEAQMDLVDITGHVISHIMSGRLAAGDHVVTIDATGLASGTYYCMLRSGTVQLLRQITIVK